MQELSLPVLTPRQSSPYWGKELKKFKYQATVSYIAQKESNSKSKKTNPMGKIYPLMKLPKMIEYICVTIDYGQTSER